MRNVVEHSRVRLGWLRLCALAQAAVLPALGIPMFFRNEAGWHYLLWKRTAFLDLFDGFLTSRSSMGNAVVSRPLVRILEWTQVRLFGLHATWYVVVNGALFAGFALALFQAALELFGAGTAVLAVLLLVGGYQVVFYPVLNAIHGLQYPLEMALCTASLVLFARAFAGRGRTALPAVILWILACVSHAASAIVVPLCVAAMSLGSRRLLRRRRFGIALLAPLGVLFAFALERSGVPGGLAAQPSLAAKLEFLLRQAHALGTLALRPPGGPLLVAGIATAAVAAFSARRGVRFAAFLVGAPLWLVLRAAPVLAVVVLLAGTALAVVRRPPTWFVFVWAAAGALLYVATPELNASYARHFVVPLLLPAAEGLHAAIAAAMALLPRTARRLVTSVRLEHAALAATILLVGTLVLATRVPVPGLSSKLEQLRYVRDLGINFRDALAASLEKVPPGGALGFFGGRSREDEMRSFYGEDYFARLQPAKAEHYDDFTQLLGRPDVRVVLVDPVSGPWPSGLPVLAVNPWETERARALCACEPEFERRRGRAQAALVRGAGTIGSDAP